MHIYKITNRINGKVYIGQTIQKNPKMRWYEHCAAARNNVQQYLYQSMRKHGVDAFSWEVIDKTDSLEKLNQLETKWIEYYRSLVECYNHRDGGDNSLHSELSKQRMSEAQKAAHARRRETNGGIEKTKTRVQTVKTWASSKKGKPSKKWSEEAKAKFSEKCKNHNQVNNFYKKLKEN
jgi:group I intron endonuclease